MSQRIRLSVVLAALLTAAAAVATMCAPWADSASPSCEQAPQITAPDAQQQNRPVVLVHGWDGNGISMHPIGSYLTQTMHLPVQPFYFDYSSHNTDWAAQPTVAGCLASYITAISKSYKAAGGDGKVIVIAHSMGGLAIRFASSGQFVPTPIASDLAGVITIDTPSLGSPFGDQALSRALQAVPVVGGHHPTSLFPARAGSDASICLAAHHPTANQLPSGCALAPYLPAGVPITQLAGDMVVNRTFFGVHLYTVDLGTDGPVPVDSAHGYVNSGPGGRAPSGTEATEQPTVSCTIDFDQIAQLTSGEGAAKTGFTGVFAGIGDLLSPTIFTDAQALDSLQSGQSGSQLLGFLLAAYTTAPCSHAGMLTDPESLSYIASAVQEDLAHPGNPVAKAAPGTQTSGPAGNRASDTWSRAHQVDNSGAISADVSCPSSSFCMVVDGNGYAYSYSGGTWSTGALVTPNGLAAVSCASSSFCMAVGTDKNANADAYTYSAGKWSAAYQFITGSAVGPTDISCSSSSFCIALDGTSGQTDMYQAGTWSGSGPQQSGGDGTLSAVSCPSSSFCMAVNHSGFTYTYSGGTWSIGPQVRVRGGLSSVSCASAAFCMAVDAAGVAYVYSRGTWALAEQVGGVGNGDMSVSCPSSSFCMAVAAGGDAYVDSGGRWSPGTMVTPNGLDAVSCASSSFCMAVDAKGAAYAYS